MKKSPEIPNVVRPEIAEKIEKSSKYNDIISVLKNYSYEQIAEYICYIKDTRAFNRKDRLKLQILDQMDFTIWACDEDFKICLWDGSCEDIYGKNEDQVIGHNYLEEFVQPLEQHQSKIDALKIIKTGQRQAFRYCEDADSRGFPIQIITQCCKVYDDPVIGEKEGKPLQAEMALNMNYEKLVQESKVFIDIQEKEQQDIEQARKECIEALNTCKERVLKTADNRANEFYNIASISASNIGHETYTNALNAVKKIINIRTKFNNEYLKNLKELKKNECTCDTTSVEYEDPNVYTLEKHSFDCVFRHNRPYLTKWIEKIELREVQLQFKLSEVVLENDGVELENARE